MKLSARQRQKTCAGRRRHGEHGLTLIELLLSLAILAVLTGFLAGGLSIARRAFDSDRTAEITSETDAAIQIVAALVGSALPAQNGTANPNPVVRFDGRQQTLTFVGLSEGRSQKGGPHRITLRQSDGDFVVEVAASAAAAPASGSDATRVVALSGIRDIRFSYFGSLNPSEKPGWQNEWLRAERLPELVSIRIDFEDARRNEPARIVALRQG